MSIAKRYLGDGVYAEFDGYHIVLTTRTDTIYLDTQVLDALKQYETDNNTALGRHLATLYSEEVNERNPSS